jgi:hypothetical protein|tara:strand:- start:233 stop:466 length:234 start_codon:yes stop_codon:yes gene_type:complete
MQAIQIKYLPATNTKGSRIKAFCYSGSITVGYNSGLDEEGRAIEAGYALIEKLGWKLYIRDYATLPNGDHVLTLGNS